MKHLQSSAVLVLVIAGLVGSLTLASAKTTKVTTHHETMGTEQLKGQYGLIGHTYTLGKTRPWNIRLESADYRVGIVPVGSGIKWPNKDDKYLVLHFTVQNPTKTEALLRFDTFRITAVDATDKNWESMGDLNLDATGENVNQRIKPGQKIGVYKVIAVPAAGEIPKIILTGSDNLVIRYDLRGKVKGLSEPFADPADKTGATARAVVPGTLGTMYPSGSYMISVDSASYLDGPLDGKMPQKGGKFLVVNMTVKNMDPNVQVLRFDTFLFKALDQDGEIYKFIDLFRPSSDKTINTRVDPGQEVKLRACFKVDGGITVTKLVVSKGNEQRAYEFTL